MKSYRITVNGNAYDVVVEETNMPQQTQSVANTTTAPQQAPVTQQAPLGKEGSVKIHSPLPGGVFKILVKTGETVSKGQVLFVIEAMKMENEVTAPSTGTIVSIHTTQGATVNADDLLMTMNEA